MGICGNRIENLLKLWIPTRLGKFRYRALDRFMLLVQDGSGSEFIGYLENPTASGP